MTQASLTREQMRVELEIRDPSEWASPAAVWDQALWDGSGLENAWAQDPGWVDVTCDVRGFIIERGRQTVWNDMLAASCDLELDNRLGRYSVYGTLAWPRIRPGLGCRVYGTWDNIEYPLFIGQVSEYREGETPGDYRVSIKAYDAFRFLAEPIEAEYSPGIPYEQTGSRIVRLLYRAGYTGRRRVDNGTATIMNYLSTRTVLDEIKLTAASDAGLFFVDNDGTVTYLDRDFIYGRPRPENQPIPSFSDDCSGANMPYAAIEPIMGDNEFGNVILVSNVSQGTISPKTAKAVDNQSVIDNGRYLWSPQQLVLCNANWVQSLANFERDRRSKAFYRINSFECYPLHDDRIWPALLGMRLGDSMVIQRTPPLSNTIIAPMLCDGLRIDATPGSWKFTVRCAPGNKVLITDFWDFDYWDQASWL